MKRKERKRILLCGLKFGRKMYLVSCIKSGKRFVGSMGQEMSCFLEIHFENTAYSHAGRFGKLAFVSFLAKDAL